MRPALAAVDSTLFVSWPIPAWLVIVSAIASAIGVGWLYWNEARRSPHWLRIVLAGLRFSLLMLVLWMLSGWSWQRARVQRPELIIAVDVSDSMATPDGNVRKNRSGANQTTRLDSAQRILSLRKSQWTELRERYQVRAYSVAEDAMPVELFSPNAELIPLNRSVPNEMLRTQSRLGDAMSQIVDRQAGRGAAAIVLLSDGITTSGMGLSEAGQRARRANVPIHAIAIGRDSALPDLRVSHLLAESQVYLGDRVTIEAIVGGSGIQETTGRVRLVQSSTGAVQDEQTVTLRESEDQQTATLSFVPQSAGEIDLHVEIQNLPGESNETNNRADLKLTVQDRMLRVLMVFSHPSYDFRYLKNFLERSRQGQSGEAATFELTSVLQDADADYVQQDSTAVRFVPNDPQELSNIDVFVFGPFDSSLLPRSTQQAIVQAVTRGGSGCLFLSASSDPIERLKDFPMGVLLPIESASSTRRDENGFRFTSTKLGRTSLPVQWDWPESDHRSLQEKMPPLHSILHVESIKTGAQVLADATSIDEGSTSPLLIAQFAGAGRTALLATDETYRWTSIDGSDQIHQRFWGQTLRWLGRGKLTTDTTSELTAEPKQARLGTPIRFELRLAAGREFPEQATLRIESADGLQRDVTLTRQMGHAATYEASVDGLPANNYHAVLVQPALAAPPSTEFSVIAPPGEQANLRADAKAMQRLAEISNGKFYSADKANTWFEDLPLGRPVQLGNLPPDPLWNRNWVALLFVSLITAEWLLRRYARLI